MISYFNSGYLIRYIFIFVFACLLWLPPIISPETYFESRSVISLMNVNVTWVNQYSFIFIWVAFLFALISALSINQILREYDLINMHSTMGLAVFILLVSGLPLFTSVNSFIIINLILVLVIQGILKLSIVEDPITVLFNISFYLSFASLFYTPIVYLILIIWLAIITNRQIGLRNFLITIIGLLLPYFFVFIWFYWNDSIVESWDSLLLMLTEFNFNMNFQFFGYYNMLVLTFLFILIVMSVLIVLGKLSEKSNYVRKNIVIALYSLLVVLVMILLFSDNPVSLLLLVIPASIIISIAAQSVSRYRVLNIYFTLLLILILANQYYQLFNVKEILFR